MAMTPTSPVRLARRVASTRLGASPNKRNGGAAETSLAAPTTLDGDKNAIVDTSIEGTGSDSESSAASTRSTAWISRVATNFLALSAAEIVCRGTSVLVTLYLAKKLGAGGNGRVEFAFNIVYWLVLIVRDALEVIAAREIARHPRVVRSLVNHVLAIKLLLAGGLYALLFATGFLTLSGSTERSILYLYGLLLLTTALGIDFVYRGLERMGLVAFSLVTRTAVYAGGVLLCVKDPSRITWVPAWLVAGEAFGIALVWIVYSRDHGIPRPALGGRFLKAALRRGRSIYFIQVSQTIICSFDLLTVGLIYTWSTFGLYAAQYRWVNALLTFGLIFQQVAFPRLARSWREGPAASRSALDRLVALLVTILLPLALGGSVMARPLVAFLLPDEYAAAASVLAIAIWRAPLLTLAFLYQTALIALNREAAGVRLLALGAILTGPVVALTGLPSGPTGVAAAVVAMALILVVAGYRLLAAEGCAPAWHHHLGKPLLACLAMIPVCLAVDHFLGSIRSHALIAVAVGGFAYFAALAAIGGVPCREPEPAKNEGENDGEPRRSPIEVRRSRNRREIAPAAAE